ncbi:MAG: glutamine ABC transporter ATP-binding protein GlnQ, partial [Halalkalicoccus sp.]|nr:glutamine ABC transporter ATP-binding protein GlnQ [Halalkalicoccus sp.]
MSREPLLRIEDVVKRYGEETALDGVSLTMDRGDVGVLIGPSGSGKS